MSDVVQDTSPVTSDTFSSIRSDAVLQNADDEKQDRNVVVRQELEKGEDGKLEIEIAAAAATTCLNDIVLDKQEKQDLEAAASLNVAVSEKTGEQGCAKEETLKIANDDVVLLEFKGEDDTLETAVTTASSNGIVLEGKQEYAGDTNDAVSQQPTSGSAADGLNDAVLGIQEPKEPGETNGAVSGNDSEMRASGVQERLGFDEKMKNKTNNSEGSVGCSLKIEVIDETALVEASAYGIGFRKEGNVVNFPENPRKNVNNKRNEWQENGGNKEKRTRIRSRRGKGEKNKNLGADVKEQNLDDDSGFTYNSEIGLLRGSDNENGGKNKKVYSRKELEAFRFVGLGWQKKKWAEVYCGLGPAVQMEYDGLVDSNTHNQYHQKHIRVNFNPRFRNLAPPSIFGEEPSESADNGIACVNAMDPALDLLPYNEECGCSNEQGDCIEDDSDEDYNSIQKPALFVTGEPDFDSGPPEDGLEYLRRVRWETAQIPKVKIAKVDRSKLNKEQTIYMPHIPDVAKCPVHLMPLKEWEDAFLADFSKLRLALSRYEVSKTQMQSASSVHEEESSSKLLESIFLERFDNVPALEGSRQSMPSSISETCEDLSSSFVVSENDGSDSTGSPSSTSIVREASGKYPTLSMILGMDSVARLSALKKRISMAGNMSHLSWDDCLWLFALSAAVDCPLDADTCAAYRSLLRKCASLRAEKLELDEEVVMLNILATIAGKYFGQLEN